MVESQLVRSNRQNCTCPGDLVQYECTTSGPGQTVYNVDNCELRLLNSRFGTSRSLDECVDGQLNATSRGVEIDNGNFISNLYFTTDSSVTVKCSLDSSLVGQDSVSVITGMFIHNGKVTCIMHDCATCIMFHFGRGGDIHSYIYFLEDA